MKGSLAIELRGLSKAFGACVANAGIDLSVTAGTIHAIVGENGAGKSTAMKMLYGVYAPDSGEIRVQGKPRRWRSPSDAIAAGIGMVHQHFMLAGPYTALENIVLGAEKHPGSFWWLPRVIRPVDLRAARTKLESLAKQYGLEVPLDAPIETLPVGVQQRVEILKLLYRDASILILDEPTAVLTPQETAALFANFRKLSAEGKTILIITHKLKEVMDLASHVTVFRAGKVVGELPVSETDTQKLANMMVGRAVSLEVAAPPKTQPGSDVLSVGKVTLGDRLSEISLRVRAGEIVGIAGVEGNGQQELLDLVIRPQDYRGKIEGEIHYFGEKQVKRDTRGLREDGLGVIPADRHREAILLERPLTENFLLGFQRSRRYVRRGSIDTRGLEARARSAMETYDVRPRDPYALAGQLSGGNQQKLVFARELGDLDGGDCPLRLLVAAQPTRGVDVGAIEFIHRRLLDARARGVGILLVSSELGEVMGLSDRILVMYRGKIAAEFERGACDERELGFWMGGGTR
ncbi:MAG TPA: ABC transporter ATP-binding protein [Bdellovibrionota bacterium]|nr:ABC transporter ATP-binding protein [Bdellovibrionota bacterium]